VRWYHSVIYSNMYKTTTCFGLVRGPSSGCSENQWLDIYNGSMGGDEISSYIIHVGLKYMIQWGFPVIHYEGVIKYIPICCSRRSRWSGRVLWQGDLCGWEDAGSDVIPARRGFCVDALLIYPVTILGAGCPVRSGARCGMFTVQVAYENVVFRGESIQLGWL
jgi:hypothetical protein